MFPGKIFCIGFHKTGTSSAGRALKQLGRRVCGAVGVRDPDVERRHRDLAMEQVPKFDAFQDNPWPLLFRELDEAWPGSKFVLTLRPDQDWLDSVVRHFGGRSTPMREMIYGADAGDPLGKEQIYRDRYRRHNDEVMGYFSGRPDDLLVLRLSHGSGWSELCGFLDAPIPRQPFPHANRRQWSRWIGRLLRRAG